jgi:glycosyltransferase involved in cell wall biosynthesis
MPTNSPKLRILVVGQTPPPFHGQAVMIKLLLEGNYDGIELCHVRMDFSREVDAAGKWQFGKLWVLVRIVSEIFYARLRWNPEVLYYPPSGPRFLAVVRDMFVLCLTRWLFRATIFHFHASGLTEYKGQLNPVFRKLFDWAFSSPDVAIRLSQSAPPEGPNLGCRREYIIANGIRDEAGTAIDRSLRPEKPIHVLFVALLTEDKGVLVAIEAVHALAKSGVNISLSCVGQWESPEMRARAEGSISPALKKHFDFPGVLTGEKKWEQYRNADIFCFPSFYHSETFPVVLLEAMCFSLPVVSSRWRGIPDVVEDGASAILTEPGDVTSCIEALLLLVEDDQLRARMARNARERFLKHFTVEVHHEALQMAFSSLKPSEQVI